MRKKALQIFIIVLLLTLLQFFDSFLNISPDSQGRSPITGAAVSESSATCERKEPCSYPSSWKCASNNKCYDYSDCLVQCPSTTVPEAEKKEEKPPAEACTCGDWETTGDCSQQGCDSSKIPQYRICTGGQNCETNRCIESAHCITPQPKCVDLLCFDDEIEGSYCSYKCNLDGKRYEQSECEQKCVTPEKPTEKVFEGVNLVPDLEIKVPADVKGGDTVEVTLSVKNTGTKSTHAKGILGNCAGPSGNNCRMSFLSLVYFYKDKEYGLQVLPALDASVSLLFPEKEIKPKSEGKLEVIKRSVNVPGDFSGNLVIVAVVDSQQTYVEAEGGEDDNKQLKIIAVRAATLPDLVATEAEVLPRVESFPATITSIFVTVKNTGDRAAVAEQQFLENKVSVFKEGVEICKDMRRDLITIKAGEQQKFWLTPKSTTGTDKCSLDDKNANYRVLAEVDALNVVAESDENNKFTFAIKEEPTCSSIGTREASRYCDISTTKWKDQKEAGQQCSHNFECKTDLCVKSKCVTEAQKEQILKIVG